MWFMTFCIQILKLYKKDQNQDISKIIIEAYDFAFSDKHPWLVRNGAKLAFKSLTDK